jgi:catechol 2,3-dioxygenase-like lactoylglutathione lyase family enzyme
VIVNQVALSVRDRRRSVDWYGRTLGYLPAGEQVFHAPMPEGSPDVAALQGIPGAEFGMSWAVDAQEFFQLEFFEYLRPEVRPVPPDWRLCDVGYGMVGLRVASFDGALARLGAAGAASLTPPVGPPGERRVCIRDPDGVLLELLERDVRIVSSKPRPRPDVAVATRSVTVSVPDLERACALFVDALGMHQVDDVALHGPQHEALWGLDGAQRRVALLSSGDFWVEVVQYVRPVGRPWPAGYSISDQGILNIALGARSRDDYDATRERVIAAGVRTNPEIRLPYAACTYLMDDDGFSVELLQVDPAYDRELGFAPA